MKERTIRIDAGGGVTVTGAALVPRAGRGVAVVLGHGAGTDMANPLVVAMCAALAERGYATLRFNFPYKELGRKIPDAAPKLERAFGGAVDAFRALLGSRAGRLVIGGKSMGGRIASMAAAKGLACDGLVFLGYPLHPAGKPESLRDAHLDDVAAPMLFVEGTRDPLCDLALLRPVLGRLGSRASLHVVDGGDHSFDVPKAAGRSREDVYGEIASGVDEWLASRFDGKV